MFSRFPEQYLFSALFAVACFASLTESAPIASDTISPHISVKRLQDGLDELYWVLDGEKEFTNEAREQFEELEGFFLKIFENMKTEKKPLPRNHFNIIVKMSFYHHQNQLRSEDKLTPEVLKTLRKMENYILGLYDDIVTFHHHHHGHRKAY